MKVGDFPCGQSWEGGGGVEVSDLPKPAGGKKANDSKWKRKRASREAWVGVDG